MFGAFAFLYGLAAYGLFLGSFLYFIGFVGNVAVPKSIDIGPSAPVAEALIVDISLLALFALQHSVMARQGFKRWWTRFVPVSIERSTYVLLASLALALLCWQWRSITNPVWTITNPIGVAAVQAVFWLGWAILLYSSFLIDHFELFGLSQVFGRMLRKGMPAPTFRTPALYRIVRHPLYLGLLLGLWATPSMTAGHLLFSLVNTAYVLFAIQLEERDLIAAFGDQYRNYRRSVAMLLPLIRAPRQPQRDQG